MDAIDRRILEILETDASLTSTEIGRLVSLSIPAVNKRITRLREDGVIRSYTVITDPKKVEKPICAFILVVMRYGEDVPKLMEYIESDPDVLECYATTGEYDYLLKVAARDVEELEEKLLLIKGKRGVIKSHTMLALCEHKFKATVR